MEASLIKVLLVEGDAKFARSLHENLAANTSSRFDLQFCQTLAEGKQRLDGEEFEAILLNIDLPDSRGLNTFTEFHTHASEVPIVILTCCDSESIALQAVRLGAQDYVVKSKLEGKVLSRVIRYAIERKRTELKLVAANKDLTRTNEELARSEESLRAALEELRGSHQQLKNAQLQLIQAEKMESVGMLAAGVAHEVKNPLQTILMGLAYLSRNVAAPDENLGLVLTDMRDAVKRADAIVRDLLYLAAAKQLDMKPENLNEIIERSLCLVNYELTRSRILVVRDFARGLPRVPVDRPKVEQVLINLFMNAIHAMPGGGTLTVRSAAARSLEAISERAPFQDGAGSGVLVEIEDTGAGIPKEKLPRIFEPFFSTKASGVGTGLGLPVSKQIIDLHGGTISVQSGARGGVRVRIVLNTEAPVAYEKETDIAC